MQAHDGAIRAMQWSHNEKWMISADQVGVVKYWQPNLNNVKILTAHKEPIRALTFSPSDTKFASCSDDASIKIWDFADAREERVMTGMFGCCVVVLTRAEHAVTLNSRSEFI
jgi:polyadenylation factor subunit 2